MINTGRVILKPVFSRQGKHTSVVHEAVDFMTHQTNVQIISWGYRNVWLSKQNNDTITIPKLDGKTEGKFG